MLLPQSHLHHRFGILGGGQLARMLALSAHQLGVNPSIYCEYSIDPAAQVCSQWHPGRLDDLEGLHTFFKKMDLVTFESEFLDISLVREASQNTTVTFFPSLDIMSTFQDRLTQKQTLLNFQIPTADFFAVERISDDLITRFNNGLVFKQRHGGYDGKGTFIVRSAIDLVSLQQKNFKNNSLIAEEFIPFNRELAITLARSKDGSFAVFPLVESRQKDNRCDIILGPETHPDLEKLLANIKKMLEQYNYVGTISFELFDCKQGLLVNEIAPRVHNSAHYSQNALDKSQFEFHILSGLGIALTDPQTICEQFAMVNLIGTHHRLDSFKYKFIHSLHWYGKNENRPGRKMGHINAVGKNKNNLVKELLKEREQCGL